MRFDYKVGWDEPERRLATIDIEGFSTDDVIAREIDEQKTFFEIELLEHIAARGPRGGVYVDVGANIGNHSVYFGKFLANYVVAIEPHPRLAPILRRNLQANGVDDYSLLPYAIGAESSVGHMILHRGFETNIGRSQVEVARGSDTVSDPDVVQIKTLDCALEEVEPELGDRPITFVKIDIEGMELDALEGATALLKDERPQLMVELATPEARSAARAFLKEFGYQDIGQRFCWTPTYHFVDPSVHQLRESRYRPAQEPETHRLRLASQELSALIPKGETFILVDEDQWGMGLVVDGRHRLPFLERDGQYWGPPPDDETAIGELERLRRSGASFIVFVWPAFWWLEYYWGFHRHLRGTFRCVLENERLAVFDLREAHGD